VSTQFVIAVTSSLTTALILFMIRQIYKARKSISRLADEHHFLMKAMNLVLLHLDLVNKAEEFRRPRR
jgi:hypothetical protein